MNVAFTVRVQPRLAECSTAERVFKRLPELFLATDHLIEVQGLTDLTTGDEIDDATVTVTVNDEDGNAVTGQTWPTALAAVSGEPGRYRGTLEDVMSLTAGKVYQAAVTIDAGAGKKATRYLNLPARKWTGA